MSYYSVCSTFKRRPYQSAEFLLAQLVFAPSRRHSHWVGFSNLTVLYLSPPSFYPSPLRSFICSLHHLSVYAYMDGCFVWCSASYCQDACFITLGKTAGIFITDICIIYTKNIKIHNHQWWWRYEFWKIGSLCFLQQTEDAVELQCRYKLHQFRWNWSRKKSRHWRTVFLNTRQRWFNQSQWLRTNLQHFAVMMFGFVLLLSKKRLGFVLIIKLPPWYERKACILHSADNLCQL